VTQFTPSLNSPLLHPIQSGLVGPSQASQAGSHQSASVVVLPGSGSILRFFTTPVYVATPDPEHTMK